MTLHSHDKTLSAWSLRLALAVTAGALVSTLLASPASSSPALPGVRTSGKPVPAGTWVRYSFYRPGKRVVLLRLAALERVGNAQWFEVSLVQRRGKTMVFKTLVEGGVGKPKRVLKAIVRPPGQLPLLLPPKLAKAQLPKLDTKGPGTLLGKGTLKVPAGRFAAAHYRRKRGGKIEDIWLSKAVAGFPLLRYRAAGVRVELIAHGKGARSEIVREPVKLDPRLLRGLSR
jgi:hypothetical protein